MSSQFDFENEVNSLTKLDAPIWNGPIPRWRRKAEISGCNSTSSSYMASPLKISNLSSNKSPAPGAMVTGQNSGKCRTPGSMHTPNRSQSSFKTPSRGDRYIPNRGAMDFEKSKFKLMAPDEPVDDNCSISKEEYKKALKENIMGDHSETEDKILAFKDKPITAEGHQNSSKVLYSSAKKNPVTKSKFRYIPNNPDRILDAPQLLDDFYLNLIDWSSNDILAVALSDSVYLFNSVTGDIQMLLSLENNGDYITSLRWVPSGRHIAVATSNADIQLWDVSASKRLRNMNSHASRVGSLSWRDAILTSGSRDGHIHFHDVRIADHLVHSVNGHTQEVCGLEWSPDKKFLASGANDNLVNVWDERANQPLYSFTEHQSAIKALGWCPWQPHVLASGGGSADRHVRFWNCYTGTMINAVDTKSQVCALKWSTLTKELVTSHGFSQNQITVWSYPSMKRMQDLMGHSARVLYLAISPDGKTVCSGAGDETLRMWKCFDVKANSKEQTLEARKKHNSKVAPCFSIR